MSLLPLSRRAAPLTALVIAALSLAFAAPSRAEDSELADLMHGMKNNLKTLAQSLGSPDTHAQAVSAVREMQVISLAAKGMIPPVIADLPDREEQDTELLDYQVQMATLLGVLADMEVDLLRGRTDQVFTAINGPLAKLREDSHDRWQ